MDKNNLKSNIFGNNNLFKKEVEKVAQTQNMSYDAADKRLKTINDFDSSLIIENIDKTVKNKAVKLVLKINTLEKEYDKVTDQLELLKLLALDKDKKRMSDLKIIQSNIKTNLDKLYIEKRNFGAIYYIAGFLMENKITRKFFLFCLRAKTNIIKYISYAQDNYGILFQSVNTLDRQVHSMNNINFYKK